MRWDWAVLLSVVAVRSAGGQSYNASLVKSITTLLDTLLDNYDYKIRPGHGGPPVDVTVHITVLNMGPISEKDMEFTFDCYFRQNWRDERLQFDGPLKKLPLASKVLKDIWRPDTYIRNGRQSYLHTLTMPNILLRVSSNGDVYVSQRLTIRARCLMFLRKFPMDTQACPINIGSLGYSSRDLLYKWKTLFVSPGIELSQYKITEYLWAEENITDIREPTDPVLSNLRAHFVLERQQGFYILQIYTPCTLIVVMSWVSFWLNKEASPARVSLGIMTVLTMSTLGLGGRDDLPKVSYSTALDIYIVACFGFVFSALVEYAIINFAHIVYVRKSVQQIRGYQQRNALASSLQAVFATHNASEDIHEMCSFAAAIMNKREPRETDAAKSSSGGLLSGEEDSDTARMDAERPLRESLVVTYASMDVTDLSRKAAADALLCRQRRRRAGISVGARGRSAMYESWARRARKKIRQSDPSAIVDKVDDMSKVMFPLLYTTFNVFYWAAYLHWIPDEINALDISKGSVSSLYEG